MQRIATGERTPFPIFPEDSAKIDIRNNAINVIVQMSQPSKAEV